MTEDYGDEVGREWFAVASDGDMKEPGPRQEALDWTERHLSMLETLEPEGDHWVQVNSVK